MSRSRYEQAPGREGAGAGEGGAPGLGEGQVESAIEQAVEACGEAEGVRRQGRHRGLDLDRHPHHPDQGRGGIASSPDKLSLR
ncbi:hypothetical protein JYK14_18420 [Siccirubricoccus sp. KC 17139]|uniref:Uncharacterized protein n=1 Tax=Siccirubricoccus soli TaxID=2899147 RepID=A0ABT1D858_9PROT|nr:hypothetical protein [Siccirubricoccus soli]MCO6418122.1 hypothetical protein [Siccirubricoccus soli]MCP2684257.1 hypothetical protein [Siccirubricoccus soli]